MGTNFYAGGVHIGKRSAAGWYCWDCRISLCKQGESRVHYDAEWHDKCPICGKPVEEEPLDSNSAGRELGFNKSAPQKKTGVKSCSSFSWAIEPAKFREKIKHKIIKDEYRRRYSRKEFDAVLSECPIQFTGFVGHDFS